MKAKVLITGRCGLLGANLVRCIPGREYQLVNLDLLTGVANLLEKDPDYTSLICGMFFLNLPYGSKRYDVLCRPAGGSSCQDVAHV